MSDYNSISEHKLDGPRSCASCTILESENAKLLEQVSQMKAENERLRTALQKIYEGDPEGVYAGPTAKQALSDADIRNRIPIEETAFQRGYEQAKEAAAKVAETTNYQGNSYLLNGERWMREAIAERIRGLKA